MLEIPSGILSQYLWYNTNIQVDKTSIQFSRFSEKMFIMFYKNLLTMAPLKNRMNLREKTIYMKIRIFNGCNSVFQKNENLSLKKDYENAANLITHDHL